MTGGVPNRSFFQNPSFTGEMDSYGSEAVAELWHAGSGPQVWQDHYYFLQTLGRSAKRVATELLHLAVKQIPVSQTGEFIKLALDDSPTKRYGPCHLQNVSGEVRARGRRDSSCGRTAIARAVF